MVFSVPGVGDKELVVKAPEQGGLLLDNGVGEDAEQLLGQGVLGNAVVVIETCLGTPADMQSGMDVGFGPFHDFAQLTPVVHVGEIQILHRSAGDDHAVILPVPDLVKGGIEGREMIGVGVLGDVAGGVRSWWASNSGSEHSAGGCLGALPGIPS